MESLPKIKIIRFWRKARACFKTYPLLPSVLVFFTKQHRYLPKITWVDHFWTHNIFRFYESIFWRKFGIRHEMSVSSWIDKTGKQTTIYKCYSFESICALAEQKIRGKIPEWKPVKIWVPKLAIGDTTSPFMFAIAFDTSGESLAVGTNPLTLSYTVTGSNPYLFAEFGWDSPQTITAATYNSTNMTAMGSDQSTQGGATLENLYYLANPSTGTNTLSLTLSSTSGGRSIDAASYSGAANQAPSASSSYAPVSEASPFTQSITTVDDNSWIVWGFGISGDATDSTNAVIRQQELSYHGAGIADTNSAQTPAGSKSMSLTHAASLWHNGYQAAISPVSVTTTSTTITTTTTTTTSSSTSITTTSSSTTITTTSSSTSSSTSTSSSSSTSITTTSSSTTITTTSSSTTISTTVTPAPSIIRTTRVEFIGLTKGRYNN